MTPLLEKVESFERDAWFLLTEPLPLTLHMLIICLGKEGQLSQLT